MPHLDHLHLLYDDMIEKNEFSCVFDIRYNGHPFRCIFIADNDGHDLFISKIGQNPFTFRVIVPEDFIVNSFSIPSNVYSMLTEYLELRYNPEHRFIPINFLAELDAYFPTVFTTAPTIRERYQTARRTVSNYDGEKYFKGWIRWRNKNTTDENMYLTASLVGYETARRFQNQNISSAWSPYENDENLDALHNWANYIDNLDD